MNKSYFENELSIFSNENLGTLKSITSEEGKVWFVGKTIADILHIKNARNVFKTLDEDEKKSVTIVKEDKRNKKAGILPMRAVLVSESGMYAMIMSSRKKEAREFQKWVTSEVLPSIRQNGGYIIGQEKLPEKERAELEEKLKALADKTAKLKDKNKALSKSNERLQKRRHELIRDNKELKASGKKMKSEISQRDKLLGIYEKLEDKHLNEFEELLSENKRLKEKLRSPAPGTTLKREEDSSAQEFFVLPDGTVYSTRQDAIKDRQGR